MQVDDLMVNDQKVDNPKVDDAKGSNWTILKIKLYVDACGCIQGENVHFWAYRSLSRQRSLWPLMAVHFELSTVRVYCFRRKLSVNCDRFL